MEGHSESTLSSLAERVGSTQLGGVLNEWSIAELIDAGQAIEDLETHPGFKVLLRVLDESEKFALVSLIHAPHATENVAALQKQLGIVKGLQTVRVALPTIREKAAEAQAERNAAAERADAERQASA